MGAPLFSWRHTHSKGFLLVFIICDVTVYISLRKKFFRSQSQRVGNRQILEAQKKLHKPGLFCQFMGNLENLISFICQRRLLQWHPFVSLIKRICIYLPLFTFKERNSGLFCPIFLKFTFNNFTSPVGLAILKFYLPGPNFTSLGHRACTIFRRLIHTVIHILFFFLRGKGGGGWEHLLNLLLKFPVLIMILQPMFPLK